MLTPAHMLPLFMLLIVLGIGMKKIKERTKTSNLINDSFSLKPLLTFR